MKSKLAICEFCEEKVTIQSNGLLPYHTSIFRYGKGAGVLTGMVLRRACKGSWSKPTRLVLFEDEDGK